MIGDMIKKRRTQLGLTQSQLAGLTGIKSTTISNYENNVSTPNENNILSLMKALECDANYLYEWDDQKKIAPAQKSKDELRNWYDELSNAEKLEMRNYLRYLKFKKDNGL